MKYCTLLILVIFITSAFAQNYSFPIQFELSTGQESYYEGAVIDFYVTITNIDSNDTYPFLIPNTLNKGNKIIYFNIYENSSDSLILRTTENRKHDMDSTVVGSAKIQYLSPGEKIVLPIYFNDAGNYSSANNANHKFDIPLFPGAYTINMCYNAFETRMGDTTYSYYPLDFAGVEVTQPPLSFTFDGAQSNFIQLNIKKKADSIVTFYDTPFYVKEEQNMYWYYFDSAQTQVNLAHITNLPVDSFKLHFGEYFYTHIPDLFAEYISWFKDGDLQNYWRYTDYCHNQLYILKYDEQKRLIEYALQLPDKSFYKISYKQPNNKIYQEMICPPNATVCEVTTYIYNKHEEYKKKVTEKIELCVEIELEGVKRHVFIGTEL